MNTANTWTSLALIFLLAAPGFAQRGPGAGNGAAGPNLTASAAAQTLDSVEVEKLLYMREEEKLARDVYLTLFAKWQLPIFENIAASEQRHFDAIGVLIERYSLTDPALEGVGAFSNPEFDELFKALILQGEASVTEALKVGVAIEEMDIVDLQDALKVTDNRDVVRVYTNLLQGSENHLRAFVSHLSVTGESYVLKYLDAATAADILAGSGASIRSRNGTRTGDGTCPRP